MDAQILAAATAAAAVSKALQRDAAAQLIINNVAAADQAQATANADLITAQAALATAAAAAQRAAEARIAADPLATAKPFRPYGTPPYLDFDVECKKFAIYLARFELFLGMSNIDESMPVHLRAAYKAKVLLSCMSPDKLEDVINAELAPQQ